MSRAAGAWLSSGVAVVCGVAGWVGLGAIELGANDSIDDVDVALVAAEETLRGSTQTAIATADALDAAADSLDTAQATSAATGDVALDMAAVAATLASVTTSVADGIEQIDDSITDINRVLDALPFQLGTVRGLDAPLTDVAPLLDDLAAAEVSLTGLAAEADELGPSSGLLAVELRRVADELRASVVDIDSLADELDGAGSDLRGSERAPVDLLVGQLVVAGFAVAIVIGNWSDMQSARRADRGRPDEQGAELSEGAATDG